MAVTNLTNNRAYYWLGRLYIGYKCVAANRNMRRSSRKLRGQIMSVAEPLLEGYFRNRNFTRSYSRGEVIYAQGEPFWSVYMITTGMVKIYDIDDHGSERTISIFSKGHIFPIFWLLAEPPTRHLYFYEAFTDTTGFIAEGKDVRRFIAGRPDILLTLTDRMTRSYLNFLGRTQNLEKSHLHERLHFVLYWLATGLGTLDGHVSHIDAPITQADIASLAGVTRESMSLEINKARDEKIYWRVGNTTRIDMDKLNTDELPKVFVA